MGDGKKILLFGNSGSGKSTYARFLVKEHGCAHLDLDTIVWEPQQIAVLRQKNQVMSDLNHFVVVHERWVIEGCYGELIQWVAPYSSLLVFMNPGVEVCLENCLRRPWEPQKYATPNDQQQMLPHLIEWVRNYYNRDDSWSYGFHRQMYDVFSGEKCEITDLKCLNIMAKYES